MEWTYVLALLLGSFFILLLIGVPVAFAFLLVNAIVVFIFWQGDAGLWQLIINIRPSLSNINLIALPMFVLLGEVMFMTGIAQRAITSLDHWLGRLPGRLSLLAVGGGTLFATMSGSGLAGIALLGSVLVPEMERKGYKKPMSIGPIMGSGTLAAMIPPSALCVIFASIAELSVGAMLIAIIFPGVAMAILYAVYIVIRCSLQPSIAPSYEVPRVPLSKKGADFARYVLPLTIIIFLVVGSIFVGLATPAEAAAAGALGSFVLAACYGKLNWETVKSCMKSTVQVTVMVFMIISGASIFSQILAFTGASNGLVSLVLGFQLPAVMILVAMLFIVLILGTFMEVVAMMMITIPMYMPIVQALGFDPIWFGVIMLLTLEMGGISPPFGLNLFVMKGVAP
ncbi:TRAP transporter large permease subunit, partial [Chloroflexota bacterium]